MKRSLLAAAAFTGLAILITWPLATHLSTAVPGPPGDNVVFTWNYWWLREALRTGVSPFFTPYLFAPYGVDLTLNTTTPLPALVGATLLSPLSIVAAENVLLLTALALNGFVAYRLARRFIPDDGAAFAGGLIFATCSFITSRLLGHFNLTSAFVLPLFILPCLEAVKGSRRAGIAAGLVLAATLYIDYYYVVYELALLVVLLGFTGFDWSLRRRTPGPVARRLSWVVGALALIAAALVVVIWLTGGATFDLGGRHMSMQTTYNPRQVFWGLLGIFVLLRLSPELKIRRRAEWALGQAAIAIAMTALVSAIAALPLIRSGMHLIASGDYVSQRYFWRTAPVGIDLSTLFFGNPRHPVWGSLVRDLYGRFDLSELESLTWLGIVPMCLAFIAVRRERRSPGMRLWLVLSAVFGIWALGPHLMLLGKDTGLILPQTLLRYVPIASNARLPARTMVIVQLGVAMMAATGLAHLRAKARRPLLLTSLLVIAVLVDQIPAPFRLLALDHPAIYDTLRDRPEAGAVFELPVGYYHGMGSSGDLDPRVEFYQTIHHRPIAGGIVARLPNSVRVGYEQDPLLSTLIRLSENRPMDAETRALPDRRQALEAMRAYGFAFVMLDRKRAPRALVEYVETMLPLELVATEGQRSLYVVKP